MRIGFDLSWYQTEKLAELDNIDAAATSIKDPIYHHDSAMLYDFAMDMTEKEVKQAVEGLYHNLNTLQSRSGNQLN